MHELLVLLREEIFKIGTTPVSPLSILGFLLGIAFTMLVARTARGIISAFLSTKRGAPTGVAYAMGRIAQYSIGSIGVLVCLDTLGVNLGTLAAAGALVSVGIGFGLQEITHNFISGIILLLERPVQKGDWVVVGETVGKVVEIEMRATKVVSRDGVAMIVPNSEFISARVINQSHPTTRKRVRVSVGVAYGSDTTLVKETLVAIALEHAKVLKEPPPVVLFRNFGDSSLDFDLAVWLDHPEPEPVVTSDLRFAIDRVFREKKIEIPFPQREVTVKGGSGGSGLVLRA